MNVKTSRNSFLILLVTVFIAETMIMAVMHSYLSDISDGVTMILDGLMLTLILAPVIFILLIRPLLNTIGAKEKLEQEILRHREKLEEKILERTEDLRKLTQAVEQSPASVVITDIDANIEYVNPKFIELTGYSLDEVKGQNPRILKSGIQPKSFYEDMWQTLTAGKTWRGEFANRKKNGEIYWENASIAPIKDETGRTTNYVGVKEDITEKKAALDALRLSEEKFRHQSGLLEKTNDMKDLLLDIITHDLKNPIGVIHGMIKMLAEECQDKEIISVIERSSEDILKVVNNATTLSQVAMDEAIECKDLNLHEMSVTILNGYKSALQSAGMKVVNNIPEDTIIHAHPVIEEVFKNYISNAIKYAAQGKMLELDVEQDDGIICVMVRDAGTPIPEEEYDNIFERNLQLDKVERRGRGLGLAIVKRIAEAHNGRVGVKRNQPTGNCFFLELPR